MSRDVRSSAIAWLAVAAVSLVQIQPAVRADAPAGAVSQAEAKRSASVHFRRGVELHQEGAYRAALIELARAYEIAPDYRVLFNIGQTHYALGEYVEASRALSSYLAQGGSEVASSRREEVEGALVELNKRVAYLRIKADRDAARVSIDGNEVGQTPLNGPIAVSLGRHRVSAETDDGASASDIVDVAGGDQRTLSLTLVAAAPVAVPVARVTRVETQEQPGFWARQAKLQRWGYGLLASGVALAVGGGVMAGLASKADGDYGDALRSRPGDPDALRDARDDLKRNALLADVLFGAALATGATGLVLVLVDGPKDQPTRASVLELRLGFQSLVAKGRF